MKLITSLLISAVSLATATAGVRSAHAQPTTQATPQPDAVGEARLQDLETRYRRSIALAPEVASYHADLGEVLQRRGRYEDARTEYMEAVRLDPRSSRNRALLGQFLIQRGDVRGAVEHLESAVDLDPVSPANAAALAGAYAKLGKWRDAAGSLEDAVRLAPLDSQYRRSLREARMNAGIDVDKPVVVEAERVHRPLMLRLVELLLGSVLAIASVALVYPIVCGIVLAARTGASLVTTGRA